MKTKNKALLLVFCAVVLVAATVLGTMAYLTDSKEAVNTFTVGKVKIVLDEVQVNPETGKKVDPAVRVFDGNENVKMIPGRTIDKDPTVTVKEDSEESYVRVKVTANYLTELKDIFGGTFNLMDYVNEEAYASSWTLAATTEDAVADTVTYEFRYIGAEEGVNPGTVKQAVGADVKLAPVFTTFTMPGAITGEQMATLVTLASDGTVTDQFKITVKAEAIQAEGFATADAAWAEFIAPVTP